MQDDIDIDTRARQRKAKDDEARQAQRAEVRDIAAVMDIPEGRRVTHRLLTQAGVFRTSFAVDPCQTAFNEGQRNLGLWLLSQIMLHTPEQYALMLKENTSE
jgi:hypothetical protein